MTSETPSRQPGSVLSALPEAALTGFLNHLLRQQSWACARLRPFAGKTLRLRLFPFVLDLCIQETGDFAQAPADVPADAELTLSPAGALAKLLGARPQLDLFYTGGDATLGSEAASVLGQLGWELEEDLSRVIGDIAAHKLVSTATEVLDWQRNAIETIAKSWVEHWQEESPMLAQPEAARAFADEVDELHERVERLEQKINRLSTKR